MEPGPGEVSQTGVSRGGMSHAPLVPVVMELTVPWPAFRLPGKGWGAGGHLEMPLLPSGC